ncbi:MAG: hypothetical protein ACOVNY_03930 [Chitinophagaceae bacterium]
MMKCKMLIFLICFFIGNIAFNSVFAQCSICTKTAAQLGEGPASSLNTGILYLMFAPLAVIAFIGYKWWKKEKEFVAEEVAN